MAYNKNEIYEQARQAIKSNNLFFIEDVVAWLPVSKPTFYQLFPTESYEFNTLKRMLDENRIKTKSGIRRKLYDGKGGDLIALYKMICTEDERRALSMTFQESKHKVDMNNTVFIVPDQDTKEALEALDNED